MTEEDAWLNLGANVATGGTTNNFQSHSNFLRYIRWVPDGAVAGDPVAIIDLVAKE